MTYPVTPVIAGFHPDPSICTVGTDHYLVTSSFEYAPAVPVFHSTDLMTWTQIGHALTRADQFDPAAGRPSGGIYAPTIRHHDGRFWIVTTNVDDRPGQLVVSATDPKGPWSDVTRIPAAIGIDPDLAWDENGAAWLTWAGEQPAGRQGILHAPVDLRSGRLLSEPVVLWRGTGGQFPEGPHLYKIGAFWYLLIAEGGTERGHAITVARSLSMHEGFTPAPSNPLLTARGSAATTQSTGHGDLVRRADGSWAMVFLGTRPRGSTPAWHVLGRETFATMIDWDYGWPVLGTPIEPLPSAAAVETLDAAVLPLTWVSPDRHPDEVLHRRDDRWDLLADEAGGVFVGRRQQHLFTRTSAQLRPHVGTSALEIRMDPHHRFILEFDGAHVQAVLVLDDQWFSLGPTLTASADVVLEIRTDPSVGATGTPRSGPDLIIAGIREADTFRALGHVDGRYLSTETAGGFTGRMIGVAATNLTTIIAFRYEGSDQPLW